MFRLWSDRPILPASAHLLTGVAEVVVGKPEPPLEGLAGVHAAISSARVQWDGAAMERAPHLRVIARTGVGYDNVSVAEATARGIAVCYTPDGPSVSTAEHTITLMLAAVKNLKRNIHNGFSKPFPLGVEVEGLCLGLVGLGRIGGRVAKIAQALGMTVVAFDPLVAPARAAEAGVELAPSLADVLRRADIVSLHVPLTPETGKLMDAGRLALMKRGAFLINAARGGLVDESALLAALDSGHLRGAGLDVLDPEPPAPDNPLLQREDVIVTPHVAGATEACQERMWHGAITQILQALRGERPPHLVNPEVWPIKPVEV